MTFDPSITMISLDLSRITGSDQLIAMVMSCASAWIPLLTTTRYEITQTGLQPRAAEKSVLGW